MPLLRFIPEATNIDFVGFRYVAFAVDGLLLAISIVSIFWWNGFNMGLDFTGGVQIEIHAAQAVNVGKVRSQVDALGFGDAEVQLIGGGGQCDRPANSCVQIRVQPKAKPGQDRDAINQAAVKAIRATLGPSYTYQDEQVVGGKVSGELLQDGILATLSAILMITIYVAVRFEWQYGIGAAVATGHDVLVTAGLFSVMHLPFSLTSIAALLTLAGYSINDTVVVFDRIRENRRKYKRMKLADLINLSTNQMVTRTILTSAATATSLIPLYFFGGIGLRDFSGPILFGIVVGTFSSTYVAAALLLYLPAPAGTVEGPTETATA